MVAYEIARGGFIDKHVQHIRSVYGVRRAAILSSLEKHMPAGVSWTKPQGGLFIWAILPENIDAADILRDAVEERVAFVPGSPFYDDGSGKNTMRLNFSNATIENIEEGIARLGRVIRRAVTRSMTTTISTAGSGT